MTAAAKLLDRLERPRQTRPSTWVAGCPCCQSRRGRPISVRELDDGRVLLHPFCGCDTGDVLAALGLTMADLFEKPLGNFPPSHSRIPPRDLLEILDHEVTVTTLIAADILADRTVSEEQWARLATAAGRIGKARDHGRA